MKAKGLVILRFVVVVLFLSYYGSAAIFTHTHQFEWGRVTHSHPYLPSGHHSHTAAGCQLVESLNHVLFIASVATLLPADYARKYTLVVQTAPRQVVTLARYSPSRAPPI